MLFVLTCTYVHFHKLTLDVRHVFIGQENLACVYLFEIQQNGRGKVLLEARVVEVKVGFYRVKELWQCMSE